MKKLLSKLFAFTLLSFFIACEAPVADISDEISEYEEEILLERNEALQNLESINLDSIIEGIPEVDARGGKVEYYTKTVYLSQGNWYGFQYTKSTLGTYKIYIDIVPSGGNFKAYAYGYDKHGQGYEYIRKGNFSTYISSSDLASYQEEGYIGTYCSSGGSVTLKMSYERINNGGGSGGGSGSGNFYVTPNSVSPSTGTVSQTNFNFKVNISSGNPTSAQVDFYAPDNQYYKGFQMSKSGSSFKLNKQLSQVGTYYYRYIVKNSSKSYTSPWMSMTVQGGGSSGKFSNSCMSHYNSNCSYARSQNAFYVSDNSLRGQCTWYTYGRVVELASKGELPSNLKQKFENAFWGKSNRHAKNWPSFLGGSWINTNNQVLPMSKRKKGLVAVWIFGSYGHVGFVEEISADGTKYRLSDFNRGGNITKRDKWYSFSGTSDRLGGVYPRFLDLSSL